MENGRDCSGSVLPPIRVEGPKAVDGNPADMALADPVGDFLKPKDSGVESGTCITSRT